MSSAATPQLKLQECADQRYGDRSANNLALAFTINPGREIRYGRWALGVELQVGVGVVTIGDQRIDTPWLTDVRFLLNAQARAGVWLTRHISLTGTAGTSVVRSDERMFGLMIGFTPSPYDGI